MEFATHSKTLCGRQAPSPFVPEYVKTQERRLTLACACGFSLDEKGTQTMILRKIVVISVCAAAAFFARHGMSQEPVPERPEIKRAGDERRSDGGRAEPNGPAPPCRTRTQKSSRARRVSHRAPPPLSPAETQRQAYDDESIPIGEGQTITPPYDVAFMTEVLDPKPTDRVYEVGTGSGYQSAILSRLVKDVYSVEIHAPLSKRATQVHKDLGYTNIHTRVGDGYEGWPEAAPFDAIIVTCAPTKVPAPLFEQLKDGGRMVIPIGDRFHQIVHLIIKKDGKRIDRELKPTLFVPMTGRDQEEAAAARRRGSASTKTE